MCPRYATLDATSGKCACNSGYQFSQNKECILCDTENTIFNAENGECSCETNFMFYTNLWSADIALFAKCIPCSGKLCFFSKLQ